MKAAETQGSVIFLNMKRFTEQRIAISSSSVSNISQNRVGLPS